MKTTFDFYNNNTAKNAPRLTINGVQFYFSYSTVVAVRYNGNLHVIQNYWKHTTGKHLNWIDGGNKTDRLDDDAFRVKIDEAMKVAGIDELPTIEI